MSERNPLFITKLHLKNFRSVREETITFDNPLFLVGKNASGKSNILDAFDFLSRAMTTPLSGFRTNRGGPISDYRYHGSDNFAITADFSDLGNGLIRGKYSLEFGYPSSGTPYKVSVVISDDKSIPLENEEVLSESCDIEFADGRKEYFTRNRHDFDCSVPGFRPALFESALVLPILGGLREFQPVVKSLSEMRVYNIEPFAIRRNDNNVFDAFLNPDGSNLPSILWRAKTTNLERIQELFRIIAPELLFAPSEHSGRGASALRYRMEFILLRRRPSASSRLPDTSASDGTLRALGHIVALMQDPLPSLIAIEEPELFLHIESQALLMDLIELASEKTQIIVSTHSPDLIDVKWLKPENLRVVEMENGETRVSPVSATASDLIRRGKMYPGKLLRSNTLTAD